MPTVASQCHAWRWATFCAIEPTILATCLAMALALAPAHIDEGDIIVRCDVTPHVTYRGVQTNALPIRTAVSPFLTQVFNQFVGSVMSVLSDGELDASRAASGNAATGLQRALMSSMGTRLQPTAGGLSVGNAVSGAAVGGVGRQAVQAMAGITSQISGALAPFLRGGQP